MMWDGQPVFDGEVPGPLNPTPVTARRLYRGRWMIRRVEGEDMGESVWVTNGELLDQANDRLRAVEAERDEAVRHLRAVLDDKRKLRAPGDPNPRQSARSFLAGLDDANPVPVQQDESECAHVWRSSFGDTFCKKCNQDLPVPVQQEPEAVCDRCGAPKGAHAVGEGCNTNCGGLAVLHEAEEQGERVAECRGHDEGAVGALARAKVVRAMNTNQKIELTGAQGVFIASLSPWSGVKIGNDCVDVFLCGTAGIPSFLKRRRLRWLLLPFLRVRLVRRLWRWSAILGGS